MSYHEPGPKENELMTWYGTSAVASGTLALQSDIIVSTFTKFVIPKGTTLKVWTRLVSGAGANINIQYANDGSTFRTLVTDFLSAGGEVDTEKRRPHLFRGSAGTEAIQITYANNAGTSNFAIDVEVSQD